MDIDKEIQELIDLIKARRIARGKTQEDVADHLGISPQAYIKIEQGKTELKLKTFYQIAEFLGINLSNHTKSNDLIALKPEDIVRSLEKIEDVKDDMQEVKKRLRAIEAMLKNKDKE